MKILPTLLLLVTVPALASEVQSVTNTSNGPPTIANGQTIRVNGTGFGGVGPYVALFDSFENQPVGSPVNLSAATLGTWSCAFGSPRAIVASVGDTRAGSRVMRFNNNINAANGGNGAGHFDVLMGSTRGLNPGDSVAGFTKEFFVEGWFQIEAGSFVGGCPDTGPAGANSKDIWIYRNPEGQTSCAEMNPMSDFIARGSMICNAARIDGSPTSSDFVFSNHTSIDNGMCTLPTGATGNPSTYSFSAAAPGQWVRLSTWVRQRNGNATFDYARWELPWEYSGISPYRESSGTWQRSQCTGALAGGWGDFDSVNINGYTRPDLTYPSFMRWDDVYIAAGPGSRARVLITSLPTINEWAPAGRTAAELNANATLCTTPLGAAGTNWSETAVTCTIRRGTFPNGTAYLYVIDANGVISDSGPNRANAGAQGLAISFVNDTPVGPVCGNGQQESGEHCDDGNTVTETACPYGFPTCLLCNQFCSADLNLTGPYCGDNAITNGESCDGAQLGGVTCQDLGFPGGLNPTCNANCTFNTSGCSAIPSNVQGLYGAQCAGCVLP